MDSGEQTAAFASYHTTARQPGMRGVSLLLFAGLAGEMLEGDTRQFDDAVRQFVHSYASVRFTAIMRFITFLGSPLFVSIAAASGCVALWVTHRRRKALLIAITLIGGSLLRLLIDRRRTGLKGPTPIRLEWSKIA